MDDKVEVARLRGRCLMIQDKIIAIQQECEEICLQSDAPDYRALYFKLFARTEEVRKLLELRYLRLARTHTLFGSENRR